MVGTRLEDNVCGNSFCNVKILKLKKALLLKTITAKVYKMLIIESTSFTSNVLKVLINQKRMKLLLLIINIKD